MDRMLVLLRKSVLEMYPDTRVFKTKTWGILAKSMSDYIQTEELDENYAKLNGISITSRLIGFLTGYLVAEYGEGDAVFTRIQAAHKIACQKMRDEGLVRKGGEE